MALLELSAWTDTIMQELLEDPTLPIDYYLQFGVTCPEAMVRNPVFPMLILEGYTLWGAEVLYEAQLHQWVREQPPKNCNLNWEQLTNDPWRPFGRSNEKPWWDHHQDVIGNIMYDEWFSLNVGFMSTRAVLGSPDDFRRSRASKNTEKWIYGDTLCISHVDANYFAIPFFVRGGLSAL